MLFSAHVSICTARACAGIPGCEKLKINWKGQCPAVDSDDDVPAQVVKHVFNSMEVFIEFVKSKD